MGTKHDGADNTENEKGVRKDGLDDKNYFNDNNMTLNFGGFSEGDLMAHVMVWTGKALTANEQMEVYQKYA